MFKEVKKISVIIIEDYKLTRVSLKTILNTYSSIEVTADAQDAYIGLDLIERVKPDVVLMDLGLPGMNGIEATLRIKDKYPDIKIIILTTRDSDEEVVASLGAGASGYCLKDISPDELALVIENVNNGVCWIDSNVSKAALGYFPRPSNINITPRRQINYREILTKRELEVLKLLVKGQSNTQIADELIVSVHTAKAHICSILQKFEVTDRVQAAVKAIKERVV